MIYICHAFIDDQQTTTLHGILAGVHDLLPKLGSQPAQKREHL